MLLLTSTNVMLMKRSVLVFHDRGAERRMHLQHNHEMFLHDLLKRIN